MRLGDLALLLALLAAFASVAFVTGAERPPDRRHRPGTPDPDRPEAQDRT